MAAFQDAAREYAAAGIVPLPIAADGKRPLVKHPAKFGRRAAIQIMPKFPDADLGFWCGQHNGLRWLISTARKTPELPIRAPPIRAFPSSCGLPPANIMPTTGTLASDAGSARYQGTQSTSWGKAAFASPRRPPASGGRYEFVRGGLPDLGNLPRSERARCSSRNLGNRNGTYRNGSEAAIGQRNDACSGWRWRWPLRRDQGRTIGASAASKCRAGSPPLPDAEVQHIVNSAWRYKMQGRLMVRGMAAPSFCRPRRLLAFWLAGDTDALALITMARRPIGSTGKVFALAPQAMAQAAHRILGPEPLSRRHTPRLRAGRAGADHGRRQRQARPRPLSLRTAAQRGLN